MICEFKEFQKDFGTVNLERVSWNFQTGLDTRVVSAALKWKENNEDGIRIFVEAGNEDCEVYHITIARDSIRIFGDGAAGAYYAIQSLKEMVEQGEVPCGEIYDYPDMKYRGVYHDITRGKVPTLETLKQLVDRLAQMKINMLQLYVEHTFEFEEYKFCLDSLGYITKEEMMELDRYCNENFIELVPSLATFGHLYHLLQHEEYKHLCELENYVPKQHHWRERMNHHTINPCLDESFELIKSLLDQYMPVFTTNKFNICGDETFDLGRGVNAGKDKGELYYSFLRKIIDYLRSQGKQVMMWADVILSHPEFIDKLPDDIIFLPWWYDVTPDENMFQKIHVAGKQMISCPGTSSWKAFCCRPSVVEKNVEKMAEYSFKYEALGLMNTNWGDYGNPCSIELALYGMLCGAAIGWDKRVSFDSAFRAKASAFLYGDERVVDLLSEMAEMREFVSFEKVLIYVSEYESGTPITLPSYSIEEYQSHIDRNLEIRNFVSTLNIEEYTREELLAACEIQLLMTKWWAQTEGINVECFVSFEEWANRYRRLWLKKNKHSELEELIRICDSMQRISKEKMLE